MRTLVLLLCLAFAAPVQASEQERLEHAVQALEADRAPQAVYYGGWLGIQVALTVGQTAIALDPGELPEGATEVEIRNHRGLWLTGAATALIGTVAMAVDPPAALFAIPSDLEGAEARLAAAAKQEHQAQNWFAHFSGIALNGIAAGIQTFAFDSPVDAGFNFLIGCLISEAIVWTRPTIAKRQYKNHQGRFEMSLLPTPRGVVVAGRW